MTNTQKWQLETVMRYLWMLAWGRIDYSGPRHDTFIRIPITALLKLSVAAEQLTLYSSTYLSVSQALSVPERQELTMHLNANPREPVYDLSEDFGKLIRGPGITPVLLGVANKILEACETNRTEPA